MVFGAGRHGIVYMWDLRGGRVDAAYRTHKAVNSGTLIFLCRIVM